MSDLMRATAESLGVPYHEFEASERDAELTPDERAAADADLAIANLTAQADALGLRDGD